ncbi:tRNA (adenine-N(1)-)-methyltransferase non-catalytic subunit [Sporothrix schenckii 1099-18]|uniref:tRNA (adenine(58)-N(1))-methyltransferase non-catalytic subunit TRM6 n=1 Tax=Sporothrix schenckii 1099-18 TaxID=1397361 RepID=A0A0F2M4B2_SPOSC|nr:tRNA (adenine-N(1)-)-methyltransferase non-catalytic subunit [Sporothrix schenckii 1099-18]KJR84457.1 tRNA (adenine-N(1)-)-methyltransferase non-catalytic subunit [Sporothrix schenckii 1099-18]
MASVIQPNAWIGLKLPSENVRFLRIAPNTTISLGKYGSFPSNLIIHRPYHLTYELLDKRDDEPFSRLRVIPTDELYADVFADEAQAAASAMDAARGRTGDEADADGEVENGVDGGGDGDFPGLGDDAGTSSVEYTLVDMESQAVIARSNRATIDADARQTLTTDEIEALKREGTGAGRDLIAKLLLSHAALDQKTAFSLAKYKLLKTKKYIRRFTVLPLDVYTLGNWLLDDKDVGNKIMDLRDEMVALLGCWANVHYGGPSRYLQAPPAMPPAETAETAASKTGDGEETVMVDAQPLVPDAQAEEVAAAAAADEDESLLEQPPNLLPDDIGSFLGGGRWLAVDDTGGLLIAALAERMGILTNPEEDDDVEDEQKETKKETTDANTGLGTSDDKDGVPEDADATAGDDAGSAEEDAAQHDLLERRPKRPAKRARDDFHVSFSLANTITLLHSNNQANLTYLKYFGYDYADPHHPPHPLNDHLLCLSWLQLLEPESDTVYAQAPPIQPADVVASWKPARRGNYHRKRRRWARTRHIVDTTRVGGFSGLVVATSMDLISTLRHALPLLASGAPVAVYSPSLEPLTALADCFSVLRRTAWSGPDPPVSIQGKTVEELETWPGDDDFPLNPMLLLGVTVQTSRVRKWQVLPGRTHPVMTARGGAEGYMFTGWKAKPAEGRVTARGKFKKRKTGERE